jgi:hypothetical protein
LGIYAIKPLRSIGEENIQHGIAKEIPINNGPYIFQNLPGLILELEDSDNNFHFTAIAMDKK